MSGWSRLRVVGPTRTPQPLPSGAQQESTDSDPMHEFSRRQFLTSTAALGAGTVLSGGTLAAQSLPGSAPRQLEERIPLVHITDLYHPAQDPDDQLDLATVAALDAFDLRAVILDITDRFLKAAPDGFDIPRDPGFVTVVQLAYLLGQTIPVAMGPTVPLQTPQDDARGRPRTEQAGIELVLDVLRASSTPVVISSVGSARVLAAAFNRDPELVRAKTRAVVLNAGATEGTKIEWNVGLDPHAYIGLWQSGLPIHWYPCATERSAFNPDHERGTYWRASHEDLFRDLPDALRGWIAYGFGGSARGDIIRAMGEMGQGAVWEHILAGSRNLWATASLVMASGRVLARTSEGWRFVREPEAAGLERWPWRLDPIAATVREDTQVEWHLADASSPHRLFGRQAGREFGEAMAEAFNALLRAIPNDDG